MGGPAYALHVTAGHHCFLTIQPDRARQLLSVERTGHQGPEVPTCPESADVTAPEKSPELTVLVPRTRAAELSQYLTHLSRYRGRNDMLHALDRDHPVLYPGKLLHKLLHRHTSRFLNMP